MAPARRTCVSYLMLIAQLILIYACILEFPCRRVRM